MQIYRWMKALYFNDLGAERLLGTPMPRGDHQIRTRSAGATYSLSPSFTP